MIESALLLFLVIDPFGNLPFVLSVTGERRLGYLNIERPQSW